MANLNMKAVVRLLGINENTLRGWERRHHAITPGRDAGGRRSYSPREVERIRLLWALVREGHTIGRLAGLSSAELKRMLVATQSPEAPPLTAASAGTTAYLDAIVEALERFDLERLHHALQRARFDLSPKEVVINLVRPLMARVGGLIVEGKLSITQEHLLSTLLRDYLGNIHQSLSPYDLSIRANAKNVVLATREGDVHEFGILLSAILCNLYRYRTFYLGPNMPQEDLVEACQRFKADILILGFTSLPPERELVTPADYLRGLDRGLPRRVTICHGGAGRVDQRVFKSDRQVMALEGLEELDRFLAKLAP